MEKLIAEKMDYLHFSNNSKIKKHLIPGGTTFFFFLLKIPISNFRNSNIFKRADQMKFKRKKTKALIAFNFEAFIHYWKAT